MYHFFVSSDQVGESGITITGSDVNHIKNVLRMKPGEQIMVSNGVDRDYCCQLEELSGDVIKARILFVEETAAELPSKLYLFQGLPKSDKMELIIQKAVELGAYEVIPVETRRAVVKLDAKKAEAKVKRWNAIAESGAKQSKRIMIPKVTEVMTFKEALEYSKALDVKLIPYELAEGMSQTKEVLKEIKPGQSVGIFIGPEGGFEEGEVEMAREYGAVPITLGKRILRTETAGMTLLSILMFQLSE